MAKTNTVTRNVLSDYDGDGVFDMLGEFTTTTDRAGNEILRQEEYDYNLDGDWDSLWRVESTFDKKGRMVEQVSVSDWDGDEFINDRTVSTWDWRKDGQLDLLTVIADYEADGDPDYIYQEDNSYDRGLLVEKLNIYDWDGNSVTDSQDRYTYTYEDGRLAMETADYGDDGTINSETYYDYA